MTYSWITFNIVDALAGTLVGFQNSDPTKDYDLSKTGILEATGYSETPGKVIIDGRELVVDETGVVVRSTPSSTYVGQTLRMVTADMGDTGSVGGAITRSSGSSGTGHDNVAILTNIEPRDQFAVQVLNAMLIHADHPESYSDALMLKYSRAAYRWAQAMMIAAADSREGQSTTPSTQVDVNSGDLQSNTEKILYNVNESLKDVKNQISTSLSATIKVDNPANDKFDVEGGGGGSSLNRGDVNDAAQAITDFLIYNTGAGNAPMRATLANTITKLIASLDATQKQSLYDSIKDKMQADFDAKGAAAQALADAKAYTDSKIS